MTGTRPVGRPLATFAHLLRDEPRSSLVSWLMLTMGGSLTESIGLLLLVPLLELLQHAGDRAGASGLVRHVRSGLQAVGLPLSAPVLLVVFVAMVCVSAWLQYGRSLASSTLQLRWVDRVRGRAFGALMDSEYGWIVRQRQSDHVSLLINDINRVGLGLTSGLAVVATLGTAIVYLGLALAMAPVLTMLVLGLGAIAWRWLATQRRESIDLGHAQGASNRSLQARLQETLTGIKLAKILGAERRLKAGFASAVADLRRQQLSFQRSQGRSRALTQAAAAIFLAGFIWVGMSAWQTPLSELLVLVLLMARLIPMFSSAQQQLHVWLNAMPALVEIDALVRECELAAEPLSNSPGGTPWRLREAIELRGATLRRDGRDAPTLDNVNLILQPRTTTAVIGASGSGKTTLADVLAGLFPLDAGAMFIDGRPVDGAERLCWRQSVAYVTQEVFLVHDTIRNNLRWGLAPTDAPNDAELVSALRQAAAEFVLTLPQGLDTLIGDGGLMLSGGERQRLALARALLRKPSLLILDEATSALDVDNEARIGTAIRALHGNVTVLLIGHRLATLQHADQVLVMHAGRVRYSGSWNKVRALMDEVAS